MDGAYVPIARELVRRWHYPERTRERIDPLRVFNLFDVQAPREVPGRPPPAWSRRASVRRADCSLRSARPPRRQHPGHRRAGVPHPRTGTDDRMDRWTTIPPGDGRRLRARRAGPRAGRADARRRCRAGPARPARPLDGQPPRPHRGCHGDGQDEDAAAARRSALGRGRAGLRGRRQGRPDRASPHPATATNPKVVERCESIGWTFTPQGHPVEFLSLSGAQRRPGAGHRQLVRAAAAGQGPGPQRDPDIGPLAHLQVLRRQRPAAARPGRSRDDAQVPRLGRGQAHPGRLRRHVAGHGRASSCEPSSRPSRRAPASSSASPSSTSRT